MIPSKSFVRPVRSCFFSKEPWERRKVAAFQQTLHKIKFDSPHCMHGLCCWVRLRVEPLVAKNSHKSCLNPSMIASLGNLFTTSPI